MGRRKGSQPLVIPGQAPRAKKTKWKHSATEFRYTYNSWNAMRARVLCQYAPGFERYSTQNNITIDPAWASFDTFIEQMGERPRGTSLDRVDTTGPYNMRNCRWATQVQQSNNQKRSGVKSPVLTPNQVRAIREATGTLMQISQRFGISYDRVRCLRSRITYKDIT